MSKYDIYVHKLHNGRRPLLEHVKQKNNMRDLNYVFRLVLLQISYQKIKFNLTYFSIYHFVKDREIGRKKTQ